MRKLFLLAIGICALKYCNAQTAKLPLVYKDALSFTRVGQAFPLENYNRIDTAQYPLFPAAVKKLLTHTAGIAISFKTNSPRIAARWCVTDSRALSNLAPINNKGLDLYIKQNNQWVFAGVASPNKTCSEDILVANMAAGEKECLLYLPTYDAVTSLSIGIDSGYQLQSGDTPYSGMKVVVYGSSITQGASASRPGMAYPARLSRSMNMNFINLGLSGSGKMEKEVADMIASIPAEVFILDCFANPSPQQIKARTGYMVRAIRAAHPKVPIILIQSVIRERGNFDLKVRERVSQQNANVEQEYRKLREAGVENLHLIKGEDLLGMDHEGTIDGTHPNDLGFDRMFAVIGAFIRPLLD